MICYERYLQTNSAEFRDLITAAAQLYLKSEPDTTIELYPVAFADAVFLMIAANRIEGNQAYLERACAVADQAVALFWDNGPLPRASSRTSHYESITRADTLARALFVLSCELDGRRIPTAYIDR
jgi:hypothetical protein